MTFRSYSLVRDKKRRGTVEYRVRWRRGPASQGWKVRLFQEEYAARRFANYLTRPNPTYRIGGGEYPASDEPLPPVIEISIQLRETPRAVGADRTVSSRRSFRMTWWIVAVFIAFALGFASGLFLGVYATQDERDG